MELNKVLEQVIQYLSGTWEFAELKRAKAALGQNAKASALVDSFRQKEQAVYTSYQGKVPAQKLQSLLDELDTDYGKLITVPEIGNYFRATERFNAVVEQFMQGVNREAKKELG